MSDTPKFEVIDRRKHKAEAEEEEREAGGAELHKAPAPKAIEPAPEPSRGPQLVTSEPESAEDEAEFAAMPPPPTAEESREQKMAYDASSHWRSSFMCRR
jgi:hypothetical protein